MAGVRHLGFDRKWN